MPLSTPVRGKSMAPASGAATSSTDRSTALAGAALLARLGEAAAAVDHGEVWRKLGDLADLVAGDMRGFERELAALPRRGSRVEAAAHHLLHLDGKHLRPMCVAL